MGPRFVRSLPNLADRPGRVLICEDSDELRALLTSRLARHRQLTVVGDVAEAGALLEAIPRLNPDAVLLDLVIDDSDPDELLKKLAAVEPRPFLIVFSGLAPSLLTAKSRETIDVHLDKTTPLRTVADLVAQAITERHSEQHDGRERRDSGGRDLA